MKIGFIGSGNMGEAMIGGLIAKNHLPESIIVSDVSKQKLADINEKFGVVTTLDSKELVKKSDIIILAVKPQIYDMVLSDIKEYVKGKKIIVTIAAGKTIKHIESILGDNAKIVRTMPNTPALVLEGMSAICPNKNVTEKELSTVIEIFNCFGKAELLAENLIDVFTGISGSSPAYTFMYIESLADAAVLNGMPRDIAYKFASQAVLGAAKMVLETGRHPGALKDMVCSPGGSTIVAVDELERDGFRSAVISAATKCIEKTKQLGNV